eukprot:scaffold16299_cov63-Phaeocystis_antarctica.AAC.4
MVSGLATTGGAAEAQGRDVRPHSFQHTRTKHTNFYKVARVPSNALPWTRVADASVAPRRDLHRTLALHLDPGLGFGPSLGLRLGLGGRLHLGLGLGLGSGIGIGIGPGARFVHAVSADAAAIAAATARAAVQAHQHEERGECPVLGLQPPVVALKPSWKCIVTHRVASPGLRHSSPGARVRPLIGRSAAARLQRIRDDLAFVREEIAQRVGGSAIRVRVGRLLV